MAHLPPPCRRLVLLVDALHASAAAALRQALVRFANVLAVSCTGNEGPPDIGLALVARVGAGVQLQVVYKPSRFVLRDFQAVLTRLREQEGWASPDARKLALALRSLVQHLAKESPAIPVPTRVVVAAHCFTPPAGGLLSRVLEEAAHALINISFVCLTTEQSLEVFRGSIAPGSDAPATTVNHAPGPGQPAAPEPCGMAAAQGSSSCAEAADAAALEAAALAAAAVFSRAVGPHENAEFCNMVAAPLPLERLTMGWLQQLAQPLAPPEVLLLLPGGDVQTAAGERGGTLPLPEPVALRCLLASQLSALSTRCTPCPVCLCHGMPTAPLQPRGPLPSYCCVDGVALLPPEAAPPDPLTVRVGDLHELRLSGRGGLPQGVVDTQQQYGSASELFATLPPARLIVERAVPMAEVDESLIYGWPQVLLPCAPTDLAEESPEHCGPAGRQGVAGGGEPPAGALAALAQVARRQGAALLASAHASLCDGPVGQLPPVATSFKQWYVLLPGSGCFLLRQMACREQLMPLQPVIPSPEALSPGALAAAESALELLPGWGAVAAVRAAPDDPNSVRAEMTPVKAAAGAAAACDGGGGARGGAAGQAALVGEAPACAAEARAEVGGVGGVPPTPDQPPAAAPDATSGSGAGAVGGSSVPAAAGELGPAPQPFSPLLLSCGCHEVLAALLRDSVRLTPRQPAAAGAEQPGAAAAAAGGGIPTADEPGPASEPGQQQQQQQHQHQGQQQPGLQPQAQGVASPPAAQQHMPLLAQPHLPGIRPDAASRAAAATLTKATPLVATAGAPTGPAASSVAARNTTDDSISGAGDGLQAGVARAMPPPLHQAQRKTQQQQQQQQQPPQQAPASRRTALQLKPASR